jgi:hypothetical protein
MKDLNKLVFHLVLFVKILTIIVFVSMTSSVVAQKFQLSTYSENIDRESYYGNTIGCSLPGYIGDFVVGVFYQTAVTSNSEYGKLPKTFYGLNASFPIIHKNKFELRMNLRGGPLKGGIGFGLSLSPEYMLTKNLGIGAKLTINQFPLTNWKVIYNIGKRK